MMKKAISTLTFAASLAAGMMVLPIAGDALAKSGVSEDEFGRKIDAEFHVSDHRAWIREARQLLEKNAGKHKENTSGHKEDGPGIQREKEEDKHKHKKKEKKKKDRDKKKDKHKDKKCGGKKKCPTPKPVLEPVLGPVHGAPPKSPGGDTGSKGGNPGGAPILSDPGYGQPPKGGSSGGAGSPGGPARDPVDRGSGTTIKPN